jgi:hypothetical protein
MVSTGAVWFCLVVSRDSLHVIFIQAAFAARPFLFFGPIEPPKARKGQLQPYSWLSPVSAPAAPFTGTSCPEKICLWVQEPSVFIRDPRMALFEPRGLSQGVPSANPPSELFSTEDREVTGVTASKKSTAVTHFPRLSRNKSMRTWVRARPATEHGSVAKRPRSRPRISLQISSKLATRLVPSLVSPLVSACGATRSSGGVASY